MLEPFYRGEFDPNAFPAGLRIASLIITTLVIGVIVFQAASEAI